MTPDDDAFLLQVFTDSHEEYNYLQLPDDQKKQIIAWQFGLQTMDYRARYPDSHHYVILRDEEPVGRVWVAEAEDSIRVLDIGVIAAARNGGIGSVVLKRILDQARESSKAVRATVFVFNEGSYRWHQRHGFTVEAEDEVTRSMVWKNPF